MTYLILAGTFAAFFSGTIWLKWALNPLLQLSRGAIWTQAALVVASRELHCAGCRWLKQTPVEYARLSRAESKEAEEWLTATAGE